jgi:hypothetical protein
MVIGAAVICAIGLGAPVAAASSGGSAATITLSPTRLEPGRTVSIDVDCTAYNTPQPSGVSSQAFSSTVPLHPVAGAIGHFSAAATIRTSVKSGTYTVAGSCQPDDARSSAFVTTLTVGRPERSETERPRRERESVEGPVHTGVGGSTYSASPAQVAAGAALVVGAGGTAVWRRRRANRGGAGGVS